MKKQEGKFGSRGRQKRYDETGSDLTPTEHWLKQNNS